jgi:formate dehydrogenase subunit gamma
VAEKLSGQHALADVLDAVPAHERLILPCLQRVQRAFGYITDEAVDAVAEFLNVSRAEVIGVLTYYHDLRRTPPPAVAVGVCVAEACQAQGVRSLVGDIEREYGITVSGEKTGTPVEFTKAYCFGNCALGPAVMVNGRLFGRCDIATVTTAVERAREASG